MNASRKETPIIRLEKATKKYEGVYAVKDIDFDIYAGEVHALAGENGAGKSTLVKLLSGANILTSGKIILDGVERKFKTPKEALDAGIAMVYQDSSLIPTMTVGQNIYFGMDKLMTRLRSVYIGAQQILQSMNFYVNPTATVSSLGSAQKTMVEIACAVNHSARIIILDEPTATLTPEEKQYFFAAIQSLRKRGISIVYISHILEETLQLADRITILRDGQKIVTTEAASMTRERLVQAMVGREMAKTHYSREQSESIDRRSKGKKVLTVENVIQGTLVKNMSFSLYAGEVAGIAGLVGSGRTDIAKVVVGALKRNFVFGGMIYLNGKPVRYRVPKQAIQDGIVYITEDRKLEGFFETMTIDDNIFLGWLATKMGYRWRFTKKGREKVAGTMLKRLSVRSLSGMAKLVELSGGNQQRVVIAKSLVQKPKVVIFDEPTRGVDVGAIPDIHKIIRSMADEGVAVLVISSYLPEILSVCDRILVARQGRIVEEFSPEEATEEKIMYAAIH